MTSSKFKPILYIIFFLVVAIVPFFHGTMNLILSHKYSQLAHKTMGEVFYGWIHGFSPHETYSGTYCVAIEKLSNSLFDFLTTFLIIVLIIVVITIEKKNSQIRTLIESKTKQDIRQTERFK